MSFGYLTSRRLLQSIPEAGIRSMVDTVSVAFCVHSLLRLSSHHSLHIASSPLVFSVVSFLASRSLSYCHTCLLFVLTSVSHHRLESCCGRSTATHAWRILTGCPDQYKIRWNGRGDGLHRITNNMGHCRRGGLAGLANCARDGFNSYQYCDWPQVRDKLTPCGHLSFAIVPLQAL